MSGEILVLIISMFFNSWWTNLSHGIQDLKVDTHQVQNIVDRYTQTAGHKGMLSQIVYDQLEYKLRLYGNYEIRIKAEKFGENSLEYLWDEAVIGVNLRDEGFELLTIYVEDQNERFLNKVFNISPFGHLETDYKVVGNSSTFIE